MFNNRYRQICLRKSTRLLKRELYSFPSTIRLIVSRDHSTLVITYLSKQYYPTQLFKNNIEKSTNNISFESHFKKIHNVLVKLDTDHKRKHEKELDSTDIESHKRSRKNESTTVSSNLNLKKRLKLLKNSLFKK